MENYERLVIKTDTLSDDEKKHVIQKKVTGTCDR